MPKTVPRILKQARRSAESRGLPGYGAGLSGAAGTGFSTYLPLPVLSGVTVTPETSLTFTAVFAAITTIATDTASLPLRVLRRLRTGGRQPVPTHPAYDLVYCEPNADTTSMRFRQALMGHTLGWGNGYCEVVRDSAGYPREMHLLSPRPGDTWPERARSGSLWYQADGGRRQIASEDVIHVAGLGWDGMTGYSPIALQRQAIGLGLAAEQFGAAFYGNAATPCGAIKVTKKFNAEGYKNLRESFEAVHQGTSNAHRLMILEDGAEFQPFSISPEDAQYLDLRKFQVIEVCRMFRLPPHKLGDYSHSHLANIEESNLDYLNTTLGPWTEALEQELNRKLFTGRERAHGLHVAHDTSALLRGNAAARSAIYAQLFDRAAIGPDEIREREGLNPLPEKAGQIYFHSVNSVPLWSANGLPTPADPNAPGAGSAPAPAPADDTTSAEATDSGGDGIGDGASQ